MTKIVFVDALPKQAPRGTTASVFKPWGSDIAPQLRENPGQWAFIFNAKTRNQAHAKYSVITNGASSVWGPKGNFQAATRKQPNGRIHVYARFVGDEFTDATE